MFRSRFFWRLYASYAALVALTAVVIGLLVAGRLRSSLLDRLESSLRAQAIGSWHFVDEAADPLLIEGVRRAAQDYADRTGVRVTVIDRDGAVSVDTHEDPSNMESHLDRREVQEALEQGFGRGVRRSRTLEREMFYVAHSRDDSRAVRVSMPTEDVDELLAATTHRVLVGALIGSILALGVGVVIAGRITAPVTEMTNAAEGILGGNYDVRVCPSSDELGILADALNRLGIEITERIRSVSSDEAQLRAMLAGMIEGVVAIDSDDRIAFSNNAARRLFGGRHDVQKGTRLRQAVRLAGLDAVLEEARRGDDAARAELSFDKDGREMKLLVTAHRYRSDDESGVVLVFDDMTELKRLESIRRDFVANVSHELKTPLTSIRGYVETLLDGALEDEANNRRFLEKIESNVQRLNHLVADLLSLARIEEREGGLALVSVDWVGVLAESVKRSEDDVRGNGVTCQVEVPSEPVRVAGDRESLTQVTGNLVDNAIKYTPEGGHVTATLRCDASHATLEVRDTGFGIPKEDLERIFERFYRVHKARSRELGGTGLGLSIVKHLVLAMNGDVSVESEVGKGSTFRVRVPLIG